MTVENGKPLFELIPTDAPFEGEDVTQAVIEYVQLALDAPDTASYLFNELSALLSAAAIVFGKTPAEILGFVAKTAPDEWPEDGLEQLVGAGLIDIPESKRKGQ